MDILFDLDGTLADITHRLHYITGPKKKDWDAFSMACVNDEPKQPIIELLHSLKIDHRIRIWSGRGEIARELTHKWLIKHRIEPPHVPSQLTHMRAVGDYTVDTELKLKWLNECREARKTHWHAFVPELVFDDRPSVVGMWRREGLTCCQVADWDE